MLCLFIYGVFKDLDLSKFEFFILKTQLKVSWYYPQLI
ncbi:hypothetical protein BPUTSESOX_894 [uncultured Gammaproteobacteria bacterium]|nr:hypothetical protein [uncultured Gammaproteobacteria bacterium]VVH52331.1 hypothetical protein BPUTSESOX_894 [uncultured Gammaproteobacteria bacterium]